MSYVVNGKIYTEHALMDEIVFNCKIIINNIVVKNDLLANSFETQSSLDNATYYMMIQDGRMTFALCPFTYEILAAYGYSSSDISKYLDNRNSIPEEDRDDLVAFTCDYFYTNYKEQNNYYRALHGEPPYGTDEYNIYLTEYDFPANYDTSTVDFDLPLHEQPRDVIAVLDSCGFIDKMVNKYKYYFSYKYLRFLGDRQLDIYKTRNAGKWDILYMPSVEQLVKDRFNELYGYNKKIYLDRYYQEAYEFNNDYYNAIMIINVIAQTFADMIVDVPEWYIRRDIFDTRSVQYFLESYGVKYFKQIPLRYQIRIVKSLNKLIKYKSSNRNNFDIVDIFNMKGTKIYKYYLFKKQIPDGMGGYVVDPDIKKMYELEFIKTEIDGTYDDHIKDSGYRYTYDEMTYADKYWDGEADHADHADVYLQHLQRDFIIEPTKLMTLETNVSMKDFMFQLEYFVGMITDSRTDTDFPDIKIGVPSIQEGINFNISDLFTLLVALSFSYDEKNDFIVRPEDVTEPKTEPFPEYESLIIMGDQFIDAPKHEFVEYYSMSELDAFGEHFDYYAPNTYQKDPDNPSIADNYLFDAGGNFWEIFGYTGKEDFPSWIEYKMPELFVDDQNRRVFGFNMEADLDWLQEAIGYERHSHYNFKRGYTLEELGVDGFIPPTAIHTITELNEIYNNNKAIYDHLENLLVNHHNDRYDYEVLKFVFQYLFTKTFDYDRYAYNGIDIDHYAEILYHRDYILYDFYYRINSETNLETKRDNIRNAVSDIITTLEYFLSADGLEYIFSFAATNGIQDMLEYISLMIGFFKSYKVSFLDPYAVFVVDQKDPLHNGDYARDAYDTIEAVYDRWDKEKSIDNAYIELLEYSYHYNYSEAFKEMVDIFEVYEPDPDDDYDYDGSGASEEAEYKMADGGEASPSSCIPYKMLDGGDASASARVDLWEIDGGGAQEITDEDVFDVDGGYPFHVDEYMRHDYFVSHFIQQVDAGYPTTRLFRSVTGIMRVVDNQRKGGSIRMTQYMYNSMLEHEEDHGYSMDNIWLDWEEDWEHMDPEELRNFKLFIDWYCVMLSKDIELLDDDNKYRKWVEYCDQMEDEPPYPIPKYTDKSYYRDKLYSEIYDYMKPDPNNTITQYELQHPVVAWVASDPNPFPAWTIDDI